MYSTINWLYVCARVWFAVFSTYTANRLNPEYKIRDISGQFRKIFPNTSPYPNRQNTFESEPPPIVQQFYAPDNRVVLLLPPVSFDVILYANIPTLIYNVVLQTIQRVYCNNMRLYATRRPERIIVIIFFFNYTTSVERVRCA